MWGFTAVLWVYLTEAVKQDVENQHRAAFKLLLNPMQCAFRPQVENLGKAHISPFAGAARV